MKKATTAPLPLSIDVDLTDEDSIQQVAMALGDSPHTVRAVLTFTHSVMTQAAEHELTHQQLVAALLSALTLTVKECGEPMEQGQMCFRLFEALWASCELPGDITFKQEAQATASYQLMPHGTESEQIH